MRTIVIGGGIGGLTAAIALSRKGWDVTVLEQAPRLEPVGSGLAIAVNGLRALDVIGLGDPVRALSRIQGQVGIRRPDGRWLTHTSGDAADERYGDRAAVMLLRSHLVDLLADALGPDRLRLGTRVTGVDATTGTVRTDAGDLTADLVVAADGIHSPTRRALFPGHPDPVYSGVTAWRGLAPKPDTPLRNSETWGRGLVFGAHPLDDETVYFYATDLAPPGEVAEDEKGALLRRFQGWHDPIPELLNAADPGAIIRNDLYYLKKPLPAMHRGRVALVGDAAHPMTPNLGQGACQAIEDAIVLAHRAGGDLAAYTEARLSRTASVVRQSMNVCRMTKLRSPLAVALRDTAMSLATRFMPDLMLRRADGILRWRPPRRAGCDRVRDGRG